MNNSEAIPHYQLYGLKAKNNIAPYFNIQKINLFIQENGTNHRPHRHPNLYQIVWITKGSGIHFIDNTSHELTPSSLYFLSPGVVHTCNSSGELDGYIIHFSKDLLNSNTNSHLIPNFFEDTGYQIGKASCNDQKEINLLLKKMYQEFASNRKDKNYVIQSFLTILLVYKNRLILSKEVDNVSDAHYILTKRFKQLVEINFKEERRINQYAKLLNVSTTYLSDCVRSATGLSAGKIINKHIILEAKRLLLFSQLNVSEVAYNLGFDDPNYFWKYFKKSTNMSPGNFRKQRQLN